MSNYVLWQFVDEIIAKSIFLHTLQHLLENLEMG